MKTNWINIIGLIVLIIFILSSYGTMLIDRTIGFYTGLSRLMGNEVVDPMRVIIGITLSILTMVVLTVIYIKIISVINNKILKKTVENKVD